MTPIEADMLLTGPTDDRAMCRLLARRNLSCLSTSQSGSIFSPNPAVRAYLKNIQEPTRLDAEEALAYTMLMQQKLELRLKMEVSTRTTGSDSTVSPALNTAAWNYYKRIWEQRFGVTLEHEAPPDWYATFGPSGMLGPNFLKSYGFFPEKLEFVNSRFVRLHIWFGAEQAYKAIHNYRFARLASLFGGRNV